MQWQSEIAERVWCEEHRNSMRPRSAPNTKKVSDLQHQSVQHLHHKARARARTSASLTPAHTLVSYFMHGVESSATQCGV